MLLTGKDIARFQVDPLAIELVPESVARELLVLPVGLRGSTLHLLLPAEAGLGSDDSIEKLQFVLERPFTHQFAVTDDLRPFVDFYYTAVYSEIANCNSRFQFQCPKRWVELDSTDNVRVRHCNVCRRSVTFCTDPQDLADLTARNECVAFFDRTEQQEFLGLLDPP